VQQRAVPALLRLPWLSPALHLAWPPGKTSGASKVKIFNIYTQVLNMVITIFIPYLLRDLLRGCLKERGREGGGEGD
jgi:hypothetical protein